MTAASSTAALDPAAAAAERKRKRLEAWRRRQQQQQQQASTTAAPPAAAAPTSAAAPAAAAQPPPLPPPPQQQQHQLPPPPPPVSLPPPPPPVKKTKVKLALGLSSAIKNKRKKKDKKKKPSSIHNTDQTLLNDKKRTRAAGFDDDEEEDDDTEEKNKRRKLILSLEDPQEEGVASSSSLSSKKKRNRWDTTPDMQTATTLAPPTTTTLPPAPPTTATPKVDDALDQFMTKLEAGAMGSVALLQQQSSSSNPELKIDVSGSMMRLPTTTTTKETPVTTPTVVSGGVITAEELNKLTAVGSKKKKKKDSEALYTHSDWESDAAHHNQSETSETEAETDDEEEEKARRAFLEALKKSAPAPEEEENEEEEKKEEKIQLASQVKSEKQRREQHIHALETEAAAVRTLASTTTETGRLYNDEEGGVMEEAERNLNVLTAAPDALEVLAELNKKKELKAVDHSAIDYIDVRKNLYIVPRSLGSLSSDDVAERRAKLSIQVRGRGAPAPVSTFEECGLSERVLSVLSKQRITSPFPVQAQCLPCIMAGRDVIGIAKTGSGKTLAYLLPMLRHIGDQPDLGGGESGPIGLVLAPARELAAQIHSVCKVFAKHLGMKSTAVYGGAGVAEQIGDLKRGVHIAVATPGRMIDILTMQSGKILSLRRVSYVVMDEADRMFDMGFAPQISAILSAVRPDRQTVLFSATFPKAVETLARKSLKYPIEVIVGGRSVASDSVTQYAEVVEEEDKFLRLLQLLGEYVEKDNKVIVFVDTQARCDTIFEQLLRCGYPSLSLHGGKEQEDRDSTISDFKRNDGPPVLVATSVAGRGLDVPTCVCVINYSSPNHLEDYVHRVGRTGRAGNKGVAYTLVNSTDEARFAPSVVRAMIESGHADNISPALRKLSLEFKEKVKKGEARKAGSGFKGKGYSYDSSEMNDAQKLARLEKRQALIEAGMIDADDEDPALEGLVPSEENDGGDKEGGGKADGTDTAASITKLSAEVLALPGMQAALMKKAGIATDETTGRALSTGANHFVEELEINDYPREARWKVTQKETTSRLQDEFQTAVTLKGEYFGPNREPGEGERKLYLLLESSSEQILQNCILEVKRLLNEETLRVGARGLGGSHRYNVLG